MQLLLLATTAFFAVCVVKVQTSNRTNEMSISELENDFKGLSVKKDRNSFGPETSFRELNIKEKKLTFKQCRNSPEPEPSSPQSSLSKDSLINKNTQSSHQTEKPPTTTPKDDPKLLELQKCIDELEQDIKIEQGELDEKKVFYDFLVQKIIEMDSELEQLTSSHKPGDMDSHARLFFNVETLNGRNLAYQKQKQAVLEIAHKIQTLTIKKHKTMQDKLARMEKILGTQHLDEIKSYAKKVSLFYESIPETHKKVITPVHFEGVKMNNISTSWTNKVFDIMNKEVNN